MEYIIKLDGNGGDAKDFLTKAMNELYMVEVKGDSVEHLHIARILLSQIRESMKELKVDEDNK